MTPDEAAAVIQRAWASWLEKVYYEMADARALDANDWYPDRPIDYEMIHYYQETP